MADAGELFTGPAGDHRRYSVDGAQLDTVAAGGQGLVFRAVDRRTGDVVALKMHTDVGPGDSLEVMERLSAFGEVEHPNVMRQLDAFVGVALTDGESPADEDFDVMCSVAEWIEGTSLEGLDVDADVGGALVHLCSIARAVDALHRHRSAACPHGLVHRDVKPSNVRIAADGRAVLVDFGIGRPLALDDMTSAVGTYRWRAPESLTGSYPQGAAVDAWGIGAVGHWLLTGEPPALEGAAAARERMAHADRCRQVPSAEAVAARIAHLLETDPGRRPASLERWADEFADCLAGRPRSSRRRPQAAVAAAVAGVAVVGSLAAWGLAAGSADDGSARPGTLSSAAVAVVAASASASTSTSALPPLAVIAATYRFQSGAVIEVEAGENLVLARGSTATLRVRPSRQGSWTYSGASADLVQSYCYGDVQGRALSESQRAMNAAPDSRIVVALESAEGQVVLLGDLVFGGAPEEATTDWDTCATTPPVEVAGADVPYLLTVPAHLWWPPSSVAGDVPATVAAGRWTVVLFEGAERAASEAPLALDVT